MIEKTYIYWAQKYVDLLENGFEFRGCAANDQTSETKNTKEDIEKIKKGILKIDVSDLTALFENYEQILRENKDKL